MAEKKQAAIIFIFITLLIDVIGIGIIIPVTPALIQELQDCTVSEASVYGKWLLLAYAAVQYAFSPLIGAISDRYGRRPVLLASLFGFGIDYLFLAFAPTLGWLFFGRVVAGLMGASFTTASAYIADISPPEKRAQNFGLIGVAFGLGFIIGPFLGGYLGTIGPRVPFMVAAGFSLLNWLYGYFILPESLKPENRRAVDWSRANPLGAIIQLKRYPFLLGLIGSIFLLYVASHAVQSTWTYFTMEKFKWNEAQVGSSLAVVGILSAVVQGGLIRIIIPKIGNARSLYIGLSLYCLGFILFAFASEGWMLMIFLIPYCLGAFVPDTQTQRIL